MNALKKKEKEKIDGDLKSDIKKLKFSDLPPFPVFFLCSKRMTGKSCMIKDIIYNTRDRYDDIFLFSRTASYNSIDPYPFIRDKTHRFKDYDEQFVKELIDSQKKDLAAFNNKEIDKVKHICLIFDDVLMNKDVKKHNSSLEELAVNGRHFYFTIFITAQIFSYGMIPSIRKNTDVFISFTIADYSTRKCVSEYYLSTINVKTGLQLLHDITTEKSYQALVAKTYINEVKEHSDFVFKYTAQLDIPEFEIPANTKKVQVTDPENPFNNMRLSDDDDFYV